MTGVMNRNIYVVTGASMSHCSNSWSSFGGRIRPSRLHGSRLSRK